METFWRQTTRFRTFGLLLGALLLSSACYRGDGDFTREGMWPLTSYSLDLAPFVLKPESRTHYQLRGWRSNKYTLVELTVTAPRPLAFDQTELAISVVVKDRHGRTVFGLQPDLNAHLERMRQAGDASWPDNEWQCRYEWGDKDVMKRVVPFIPGKSPEPQSTLACWDLIELPENYYVIDVRCVTCPADPTLQATLSLSSGWK